MKFQICAVLASILLEVFTVFPSGVLTIKPDIIYLSLIILCLYWLIFPFVSAFCWSVAYWVYSHTHIVSLTSLLLQCGCLLLDNLCACVG